MEKRMEPDTAIPKRPAARWTRYVDEHRELLTISAILLALVAIGVVVAPNFASSRNLFNVLRQAVGLGLVSVGQTVAILVGGIDLSVGATISLVGVYTTGLMVDYTSPGAVALIVLAMILLALVIGFTNSLVITRLQVAPFIATMGVGAILQGLVLLYAKRPGGKIAPGWEFLAEGKVGPVPFPVLFLIAFAVLAALYLRHTSTGRHVVATGGSELIARLSGIVTWRVIAYSFMFSSFMAALSGLYLTSRMGAGDPLMGGLAYDRYDLDSIAAVLIGGTRLGGGKGGVLGTMVGVLIVCVLNNIFNLTGVNPYLQWVIKGLIFISAVAIYATRRPKGRN
jgi:ribose transport system permease protein